MDSAKDSAFSIYLIIYGSYGEKEVNPKATDFESFFFQLLDFSAEFVLSCFFLRNEIAASTFFCFLHSIQWRGISLFLKQTNKFSSKNYCLWK